MCVKSTVIGCALLATLALAIIHDISTPNSATKKYRESSLFTTFCQNKTCVKVNMRKVLRFYPNLFVPVTKKPHQLEQKFTLNYPHKRIHATRTTYNTDSDTCCPTEFQFDNLPVRTNIHGQERVIVRCSLFRQLIPTGRCLPGKCRACELVNRTMSILVVKFKNGKNEFLPLEFDQFEIPIYCTCLSSSWS